MFWFRLFLLFALTLLSGSVISGFTIPRSTSSLAHCGYHPAAVVSSKLHASSGDANEGTVSVTRSVPIKDNDDDDKEETSTHDIYYRVVRPMSLSSQKAAPIVALAGGPGLPSQYLYPLEDVIPYRSIVFHDQLGCGKSDQPENEDLFSIANSVQDLRALLKKLGIRRFHLYGQSYGGILAYEYMKYCAEQHKDDDDEPKCLSAVLSSAPTNIDVFEAEASRMYQDLLVQNFGISAKELEEIFRLNHQCRLPEEPELLKDSKAKAGKVWRGTHVIADYVAKPPSQDAARMPSSLILRGEYDFVSQTSVDRWKSKFNTKFLRYKTLEGCSHHALFENGKLYGETLDSYFSEYD